MAQQPLEQLMQKEVERKEFLTILGFGAASLFGFSSLLNFFGKGLQHNQQRSSDYTYGEYNYGGRK